MSTSSSEDESDSLLELSGSLAATAMRRRLGLAEFEADYLAASAADFRLRFCSGDLDRACDRCRARDSEADSPARSSEAEEAEAR